jgi:hypothetical protein
MTRNSPYDSRKYNYVYKITCTLNNKVYIGVHRTDNLDDDYMGSGTILKRAINLHGKEHFIKEILQFFDTYKEALEYEASIVTTDFINESTNYNIRTGGYGKCSWSEDYRRVMSSGRKKKFQEDSEFRLKMLEVARCPVRRVKTGIGIKKWIAENPDKHQDRMNKINLNPDKIKKTADAHRGTKRSKEACSNIKDAINKALQDPEVRQRRSGKGKLYCYDPKTGVVIRVDNETLVPEGYLRGNGKLKSNGTYRANK